MNKTPVWDSDPGPASIFETQTTAQSYLEAELNWKEKRPVALKRDLHPIPDYVLQALTERNLMERYQQRPPYQRNDYIGWITRGKREETRMKRLNIMLTELESGEGYMGLPYKAK